MKAWMVGLYCAWVVVSSHSQEPLPGPQWGKLPPAVKVWWFDGWVSGLMVALDAGAAAEDDQEAAWKQLRWIISRYKPQQVISVMDDLYVDPANAGIPRWRVALLAARKLEGDDISAGLTSARRDAAASQSGE